MSETFMGRAFMIEPEPATPVRAMHPDEVATLLQDLRDALLCCEWFGALKEHLDGERMDRLCLALGLPEVGVSLVALDAVLRACAQKAMDGKILP